MNLDARLVKDKVQRVEDYAALSMKAQTLRMFTIDEAALKHSLSKSPILHSI
jgi:hypothetical protein